MAWLSGGDTNSELVDNLVGNGLISDSIVENAFRSVDRKLFVPKGNEDIAYSDQPLKEGNIHVSAPHIYCTALENLDLKPNSPLTFLNVGSGTGYLSCLVSEILGPKSLNVGVDIHQDVIEHGRKSIQKWQNRNESKVCGKRRADSMIGNSSSSSNDTTITTTVDQTTTIAAALIPSGNHNNNINDSNQKKSEIQLIHGNGLEISPKEGECLTGFDRIYIGAAIESSDLPKIKNLLSPGGVLVGPVDDEMVKMVRIGPREQQDDDCSNTIVSDDSSSGSITSTEDLEFTTQIISSVRFAPLINEPKIPTIIPAKVWSPFSNHSYPDTFQRSIRSLLLCSSSQYVQPEPRPRERINLAATLPRDVWLHIISFTNRKWFEPKNTHVEFLQRRIVEEQKIAIAAQKALAQAHAQCLAAEHERNLYRHLARRLNARFQAAIASSSSSSESSHIEDILMEDVDELGETEEPNDREVRQQTRTVSISSNETMESNDDL